MAIRRFLTLTVFALLVLTVSASTPPTSSVTVPTTAGATVTDTWTGVAAIGTNPASDCAPVSTSSVDEHVVTVNVPSGAYNTVNAAFTFQINWTPASGDPTTSDLILTVVAP
jgi:hypothetical protein